MSELSASIVLALAGLLLMSGLSKILYIDSFRIGVHEYRILPRMLEEPFAWTAAVTELLGAVMLLTPAAGFAAVLLTGLLSSYVLAIAINLKRGSTLDCHCFEALGSSRLSLITLIRALYVLSGCLFATTASPVWRSWTDPDLPPIQWAYTLGYVALLCVIFLMFQVLQQVSELVNATRRRQ